jgi:hypothetical protein
MTISKNTLNPDQRERIFQLFIKRMHPMKTANEVVQSITRTMKITKTQVVNELLAHLYWFGKRDLFNQQDKIDTHLNKP